MECRLVAAGFRPTFLAAGVAALLLIPAWAAMFVYGDALANNWPPTLWHAHEMIFGFVGAAIAGFLLTAVPSWTGRRGFAGWPLAILLGLWLLARILIATSAWWPPLFVAIVDAGFFLFLVALLAPPLLRTRNRNTPLLLVVALLALCNVEFHRSLAHFDAETAGRALIAAIDTVLILVTVIGGRIIPAFTSSALRAAGDAAKVRVWPLVGPLAIAAMVAVMGTDLVRPDGRVAGIVAGVAAALQALRLLQWRTDRTLKNPIVWVLHLGYAWIPLGLGLKCAALLGGFAAAAFWLHALTAGTFATMILGVMTRAALGHSGRPLEIDPLTILAYFMLLFAGLTRVFGFGVLRLPYPTVILISAFFWTAAFALFLYVYAPILCAPRADGKAG